MSILEIIKVIVLGLVEGFTEWLPISSTGHLELVNDIIVFNVSDEFYEMFKVVIQLGAMMAVALTYFQRLNPFSKRKNAAKRRATTQLWIKILIGCLPASILGLLLDDFLEKYLSGGFVIAIMLILYGIIFILVERAKQYQEPMIDRTAKIDYGTALYIGAFQVLALIPGTSRSGVTILGAILLGCSRAVATEFSFFLGLPIIAGASGWKLFKLVVLNKYIISSAELGYLIIGCLVAFIASAYSIKILIDWIKKHDFKFFGYYRIVIGVVVLIWFGLSAMVA
ncbi:MAG: undecaprenyl-diphosphate phosphatase [Johnsonella sp.]|nr:undecaprenyl-diphosphate phosphatase [Johnsonella sp.]